MRISIVIPTLGRSELIHRCLDSLMKTRSESPHVYDISLGFDPSGDLSSLEKSGQIGWAQIDDPSIKKLRWNVAPEPGMHAAIESAVLGASGDWLVMVHDDMVFLPGWDDFSFGLDKDLILCFELLDEYSLTWPPAVGLDDAVEAAATRKGGRARVRIGGPFFGTSLCHRSRWVPWPSWSGTKYRTHDTAWVMETHLRHPDVAVGWMPGNCLYHTVGGSVRHKADIEPDNPREFEERYGMTAPEAAEKIYAHSRSLREDISCESL